MVNSDHRVLVIGLDSLSPEMMIKMREQFATYRLFRKFGLIGVLESTMPPMTIPAWASMVTGMTPAELELWGFRNRLTNSFFTYDFASSRNIAGKALWDTNNIKSVVFGLPPTYPPYKINGVMVSGLMTPTVGGNAVCYVSPCSLKPRLDSIGDYIPDVDPRKDYDKIFEELTYMTEVHFEMFRYLLEDTDWQYAHIVEIGLDRLHHIFWRFFDEHHWAYDENNSYKDVFKHYYRLLDMEIKKTSMLVNVKEDYIIVVSDHGIQGSCGGVALNRMLMDNGYLKLKVKTKASELTDLHIDRETTAWAYGGLYGRVFVNLKGRERNGTVEPSKYEDMINELTDFLLSINDGTYRWPNEVYTPFLDNGMVGNHPDIIVMFDDMRRRVFAGMQFDGYFPRERVMIKDDANHSKYGVFMIRGPGMRNMTGAPIVRATDFKRIILDLLLNNRINIEGVVGIENA